MAKKKGIRALGIVIGLGVLLVVWYFVSRLEVPRLSEEAAKPAESDSRATAPE